MRVLLLAGEPSGDRMAAGIARALRAMDPAVELRAMGSAHLVEAGVPLEVDATHLSVVGITEVAAVLPGLLRARAALLRCLDEWRPDVVVPIDYPDFNLRLARQARRRSIPVAWLVSPQVWAWRPWRVADFARAVSRMLVLFPFEVETWRRAGVDVEHVGHPLMDLRSEWPSREEARRALDLRDDARVVALLPGSRRRELRHVAPDMLRAAGLLAAEAEDLELILALAPGLSATDLPLHLAAPARVRVVTGSAPAVTRAADVAAVASGTATLDAALAGTPLVAVYRVSALTMALGRPLADKEFLARGVFSLPNLVLGERVVPELLQEGFTPEALARKMSALLNARGQRDDMLAAFARLEGALGGGGAFDRIARAVVATAASA